MKAISLWQPWASAIALSLKRIETRGWKTPHRGELAIHAAKKDDGDAYRGWREMLAEDREVFAEHGYVNWEDLPFGAVVATSMLTDVRTTERLLDANAITEMEYRWGGYGDGRFGWMLAEVKKLDEPAPARGFQQLWEWNAEVSK